jgi:hypothetical protein
VLHIRYRMYAKEVPSRFQRWLGAQERLPLFALLETVCKQLFPELAASSAAELRGTHYHIWMLPVAIVALKHHLAREGAAELSVCGRALRVDDRACTQTNRRRRLLLPRRALARAGFRSQLPDDLRCATRALVEAVERSGGTVVREGAPCFLCDEEALVLRAAADVMGAWQSAGSS